MPDMLPTQAPDDRPYYSLDLPTNALAPRAARALAVSALAEWDVLNLADDVELVVSELVTNALGVADEVAFTIMFAADTSEVEVSVWDDGAGMPTLTPPAIHAEKGRGLPLVAALAAEWGCSKGFDGIGKTTWAKLGPKPTAA
jgi:anti-sigma regulatory factor (Ser/Thr protein kinase)